MSDVADQIAMGEYLDVTPSWETADPRVRTMLVSIAGAMLIAGIGIGVAGAAGVLPSSLAPAAAGLSVALMTGFPIYTLLMLGEPRARRRRVYAASGRIDVVTPRGVRGYAKDRHNLTPDPQPIARFPGNRARLTLTDRDTGATRTLSVFNHQHAAVVALWNQDAIAPRFGDADR